mmetsp:Transcript_2022/g.2883  ORF Transcript_2022/g.2883 Transcript_2022/m.2883 type:complete len:191 (-) Transcript_2022:151-723(-)
MMTMNRKNQRMMALKCVLLMLAVTPEIINGFSIHTTVTSTITTNNKPIRSATTTTTALHAKTPVGPIARAKKAMDPNDYNRVVERKMKMEKLTREQAEEEYNAFLENPGFYYSLDKKESYYKSLGYKDMLEGIVGEAEKEGKGDEVRERIENFRRESKIKAYGVLVFFVASFWYARTVYLSDPDNFLPGL